jgi:hypothetical protein
MQTEGEFMDGRQGQGSGRSEEFARELQALRNELIHQFRGSQWGELSRTLEMLARVGEMQGSRELCLRAQSLRELMGIRSDRSTAGGRVSELFHDLMFHLSHLQWVSQTSH